LRQVVVRQVTLSRHEVWMGAGLVAAFLVTVASTAWDLRVHHDALVTTFVILLVVAIVDAGLCGLPWTNVPQQSLLVFPLILVVTEIALASHTDGVAAYYTGYFTLGFVYIGLTQPRGTSFWFVLFVVPAWIYTQQGLTGHAWIRVLVGTVIWVLVGEVVAGYASVHRARSDVLRKTAHTDILTGLASRLVMTQRIDSFIATSQVEAASLLVLDLDGFKAVNDAYGHSVGDELLVAIGRRIRANVSADDVIARLGGDEFAVLLERCTPGEAILVGQRLIESVGRPIDLTRGSVAVTASAGIVDLTRCASAQDALGDGDVAMYEAKLAGKNRYSLYKPEMAERIAARLKLGVELRTALEQGQFEAHYQPVVQVETGEVVGFEALLRWNHPERGRLAAGAFIEVCEEIGLIVPLGKWILHEACRQAGRWQAEDPGRHLSMAVNLSSRQLFDTDLVAEVESALSGSDLRGDVLVLEITERLLLVDSPFVLRQLDQLKRLGVRIAIDDFGTGYSSLAYLRDFPVDILKIDRSFVEALDLDDQAVALAKSIVGIAEALQLDVIAEGMETRAQVDVLYNIGCHVMQGFYFSEPKPAPELQACLASRYVIAGGHRSIRT
jgi:diguanylate cyclase (GGDEF)-like protein